MPLKIVLLFLKPFKNQVLKSILDLKTLCEFVEQYKQFCSSHTEQCRKGCKEIIYTSSTAIGENRKAFKCMSESAIGCLTKHKFSCFFISYSYILELSVWLNTA